MAITVIPMTSAIKMKLSLGLDPKGNEIVRTKSFGNVKTDAANDDVYAVAKAIEGMLTGVNVQSIDRADVTNLSE
ncbi:DUF1659 domain-containing protein [Tepidibacter sp. Z1-5]|uniref:DUF1659 domain-containing protein n=1 Tax=Tepidibacter sp. Z1-5 TaxID=3134138 RepID=UPI0030C18706